MGDSFRTNNLARTALSFRPKVVFQFMPDGPDHTVGKNYRKAGRRQYILAGTGKTLQYHPVLHVACGDLPVRPKLVLASPPGPGVAPSPSAVRFCACSFCRHVVPIVVPTTYPYKL